MAYLTDGQLFECLSSISNFYENNMLINDIFEWWAIICMFIQYILFYENNIPVNDEFNWWAIICRFIQ